MKIMNHMKCNLSYLAVTKNGIKIDLKELKGTLGTSMSTLGR